MLTPTQKKQLDLIADRLLHLHTVRWECEKKVLTIKFELMFPEEKRPKALQEWSKHVILVLTGVQRLFVTPESTPFPPELPAGPVSSALMSILVDVFEEQPIYEWTLFDMPERRFVSPWNNGWDYTTPIFSPGLEFLSLFKEKFGIGDGAVWVLGVWFSDLAFYPDRVSDDEPVDIDAFLAAHFSFAQTIQP